MSIRFKLSNGSVVDAPKNRRNLDEVRQVRAELIRREPAIKRLYRERGFLAKEA